MFTLIVESDNGYDLRDAYDLVRNGLLDERLDLVKIQGQSKAAGAFSSGDGPVPAFKAVFTAKMRDVPDDEFRAFAHAKLREVFGDKAVIRFEADEE